MLGGRILGQIMESQALEARIADLLGPDLIDSRGDDPWIADDQDPSAVEFPG